MVLLAAAALSGCGGGDSQEQGATLEDVQADVQGLSGEARTKKLVELAQADEGGVTVYTTSNVDLIGDLADAFEEAYDIDVSVFKTSRDGIQTRVIEERKADFHGADVIETNAVSLTTLSNEGALTPYRSPSLSLLAEGSEHENWLAEKVDNIIVAWNTDNVSAGEEPRSYEDLADPKWEGRISLVPSDAEWYRTLWEHWVESGKTPEEADRLFDAIGRNAVVVPQRSLQLQLLISGELDVVAAQQRHNVQAAIDEGAPLGYEPVVEPVLTRPDGVAVVEEPPHPAAAMLFTDWLLSDGQDVIAEYGADALRRDLVVAPSIQRIAGDIPSFIAEQDKWESRWEGVLGLGEETPESG